jgi:hypothetical protein
LAQRLWNIKGSESWTWNKYDYLLILGFVAI